MNNYHIYDEIAKGNHCVIYKARRKQTIDYYAVKSLEKCRRQKLMNEVKVASTLEHENVLRFHNWYETKNHLWVISEYASGANLLQLLEQDKKLTENQVRIFAKDLVQGLLYLHSKGVLYCDLKPSKILLNEYGTLKYCDFGLAKRIVDLIQSAEEIKEGPKKGTPSYMSPELFEEDGVFSIQSDIWALGCLVYEMAVGKPPFESDTFQGLVHKVAHTEPERVNGFSEEYHQFLISLLDKNPLRRISWRSIITHPFLRFAQNQLQHLQSFPLPQQTHFDRWASQKYSQQQRIYEPNASNKEGLNVLRISLNAKKNFKRELQAKEVFQALQDAHGEGDFVLPNRDQTLDIGGQGGAYSSQIDSSKHPEIEDINYSSNNRSNNENKAINYENNPATKIYLPNNNTTITAHLKIGQQGNSPLNPVQINLPNTLQPSQPPLLENSQSQQRLMNSSKLRQTPVETQRQGSQRLTSPNNLQRTPPNPKYDSNQSNFLATSNYSSQNNSTINNSNSNSSRQANLSRTPQTPGSQHAKSVSPYHGSAARTNQKAATVKNTHDTSNGTSFYSSNNQQSSPISNNPMMSNNTIGSSPSYFHHSHTLSATTTNPGVSPLRNTPSHLKTGSYIPIASAAANSTSPISKKSSTNSFNNKQILQVQSNLPDKKMPSIPIEPIEKLLVHPSDNQVKPIIGHSDIEKEEETRYKVESLPFSALAVDEVERNYDKPEVDALFGQIFTALHQGNTDKYNILCYFESFIKNSKVANRLIGSAFVSFLLEIVQISQSPAIRLRAASCIGFLLRFATAIDTPLSSVNLPAIVVAALNVEGEIKVKRKLVATLGEYLFYAATQVDEDPQGSAWRIDPKSLQYLLHVLSNTEEDEIVRFYACKTIENITSQSVSVGMYFCSPEGVSVLVQVYYSCKIEELKSCVLVALCHICRLQPMLASSVIECLGGLLGLVSIIQTFRTISRIIQSSITLMNTRLFQLCNNPAQPNWLNGQLSLENTSFLYNRNSSGSNSSSSSGKSSTEIVDTILGIIPLLESGSSVLRGKCILAVCLLTRLDPWCLVALASTKFYNMLDKLSKDGVKYVVQAFYHLNSLMQMAFPILLAKLQTDIGRLAQGQMLVPIAQSVHLQQMLAGFLPFLKVIIALAGCCSQSIVKQLFTEQSLKEYFDLFAVAHASVQDALSQPKELLMNLCETILANQSLVIDQLEFFVNEILPKIMDSLSHSIIAGTSNNSSNSNTSTNSYINNSHSYSHNNSNSMHTSQNNNTTSSWKFNCVKLIHDLTVVFAPEWQKWSQQSLQRFHELFIHQFIEGILPALLITPEEPIKLLVFRIIQTLVETQPTLFVSTLRVQNLLGHLLSQFTFTASRSALRIASKIAQTSSLQEIASYDLITRASTLYQHFYARQQDQCLEDTIDVLIAACTKINGTTNNSNTSVQPLNCDRPSIIDIPIDQLLQIQHQESLINAYPTCCSCLVSSSDPFLADKSVTLIIYILHFFSSSCRASMKFTQMVLRNDCIGQIMNSIMQNPQLQRNIRVLNWIVQLIAIPKQLKDSIGNSLNKLILSSKDFAVISAARELGYFLRRD